jgi:hypothetical protein
VSTETARGPHIHQDIGILDDPTSTPADRARVVTHLRECLPCSQELIDTLAVVAELRATAAVPFPDVAELPSLRAVRAVPDVAEPAGATVRHLPVRSPALHRYRRPAAAAAAAVVLLGGGWAAGHATGSHPPAVAAPPVTATVALAAVAGSTATGQASMTGTGEKQVMHIRLTGLPAPGPGEFYSVSLVPRAGAPLTLGVLVDGAGQFALPARLVSDFVAIDIDVNGSGPAPVSLARGSLA